MSYEIESVIAKKAMALDLIFTMKSNPEKKDYTVEEIEEIIKAYIAGLTQK